MTGRAKKGIVPSHLQLGTALQGRRNLFVAREGIPLLLLAAIALAIALRYFDAIFALLAAAALFWLFLIFRDPQRVISASPLGVVSPVDGRVLDVGEVDRGTPHGKAHRVRIRIDSSGTYTARAPIEGKVMDLAAAAHGALTYPTNALWIRSDEGDDVVLQFSGYRFGLAPRAFAQFGERLGQGQRCANLRLTRIAELHLPVASKVLVVPDQVVVAGTDLIGALPHP